LRGDVTVALHSNRQDRIAPGATVFTGDRELLVAASRRHGQRWVVSFDGVAGRLAAEALTGSVLTARREPEVPDGEVWLDALVGREVRDRAGVVIGRVLAIEANPAHDLLVVDEDVLVPVVFVVDYGVDDDDAVIVDLPEGLVELNRRDPPRARNRARDRDRAPDG
jgi:16S rRNA processing protein RimM